MSSSLRDLDMRMQAIEAWKRDRASDEAEMSEIIAILKELKITFRWLTKLGKLLKWMAGIAIPITAAYAAIKKWM